MTEILPEKAIDLPRTDLMLDLAWWTHKIFNELAFSNYGEFDEDQALKNIEIKYGVLIPTDDESYWMLQDRVTLIARYDEHDFAREGEFQRVVEEVTRFDEIQGEA